MQPGAVNGNHTCRLDPAFDPAGPPALVDRCQESPSVIGCIGVLCRLFKECYLALRLIEPKWGCRWIRYRVDAPNPSAGCDSRTRRMKVRAGMRRPVPNSVIRLVLPRAS